MRDKRDVFEGRRPQTGQWLELVPVPPVRGEMDTATQYKAAPPRASTEPRPWCATVTRPTDRWAAAGIAKAAIGEGLEVQVHQYGGNGLWTVRTTRTTGPRQTRQWFEEARARGIADVRREPDGVGRERLSFGRWPDRADAERMREALADLTYPIRIEHTGAYTLDIEATSRTTGRIALNAIGIDPHAVEIRDCADVTATARQANTSPMP